MPVCWDDATTKQLLLAIVHLSPSLSAPDWDKVALIVGGDANANGCKQFYGKLKRNSREELDKLCGGATSAAGAPPKTPAKRAVGKKADGEAKVTSSNKRKTSEKVVEDEGEDDVEESPTKKVKEVKEEEEEEQT